MTKSQNGAAGLVLGHSHTECIGMNVLLPTSDVVLGGSPKLAHETHGQESEAPHCFWLGSESEGASSLSATLRDRTGKSPKGWLPSGL